MTTHEASYAGGVPAIIDDKVRQDPTYQPAAYQCGICGGWYDLRAARNRATNFCIPCQDEAAVRIKEPTEVELAVQAEKRRSYFGKLRVEKAG